MYKPVYTWLWDPDADMDPGPDVTFKQVQMVTSKPGIWTYYREA